MLHKKTQKVLNPKVMEPSHISERKICVIYNPNAGQKRRLLAQAGASLEEIRNLLEQYQLPVDYFATKGPRDATALAKKAVKEKYKTVIAVGGDGTVGEVANGLVGSDVELGILPLGSFMNVAKMLAIPFDLEKAVMLLKMNRSRKIDVGCVTMMGGEKTNYYFMESCGIGLEAEMHEHVSEWEKGNLRAFYRAFKTLFSFYKDPAEVTIDGVKIKTRAIVVNVSNGPYSGASLEVAPKAKLNDHRLTVTLYKMSKADLFNYFFKIIDFKKRYKRKVETFQGKEIKIETKIKRLVHADARIYGQTPVEFKIVPNALHVITGFPSSSDLALLKRTLLDP